MRKTKDRVCRTGDLREITQYERVDRSESLLNRRRYCMRETRL